MAKGCKRMTRCGSAGGKKSNGRHSRAENASREAKSKKQERGRKCWRHNRSRKMECVREEVRRNSEPLGVKPRSLAY